MDETLGSAERHGNNTIDSDRSSYSARRKEHKIQKQLIMKALNSTQTQENKAVMETIEEVRAKLKTR